MSHATVTLPARPLRAGAAILAQGRTRDLSAMPRLRRGTIRRDRLVQRLAGASEVPLVLLGAPAGYGKTTLLAQWAQRDERDFAWMAPDEGAPAAVLERLGPALDSGRPLVLVIDGAERVLDAEGVEALGALARELPAGCQIALASRGEPALSVGGLRAHGHVIELGAADLAMTRREGAAMLSMAAVDLASEDLATLMRRTEGWPAALYLAALSLRGRPDVRRCVSRFAGDHRLVADFLRDEVLRLLPADRVAFLIRTSILETLTGPACDAVLGSAGSGAVLRDLARAGVPLMPLDQTDSSFRHHQLLGEMLRTELRRREPEQEAVFHRRASRWHAREGDVESALDHAIEAGDARGAGRRLWALAGGWVANGRVAAVQDWLDRFRPEQVAAEPTLALTAATVHLANGDRDRVEHWTGAAERALRDGADAEPSLALGVLVMRAAVGRDGLAAMEADAARAYALAAEDSAWRPLCCLLLGVSAQLSGDAGTARPYLEEGARRGGIIAASAQVLCLAQLALLAIDEEEWEQAALLASRARAQVERVGLEEYTTCALVYAVSAQVRAHRERVEGAQEDRRRATALLGSLVDGPPWYEVEARVALARAALRLGDVVGSRALLGEAARACRAVTAAPVLEAWVEQCRTQTEAFTVTALVGPSSLTTAELRVLRMLPTHLSFREMGVRLQVSANTIKTHAHAVYRKLDARSRSEAVVRAGSMGLLDV